VAVTALSTALPGISCPSKMERESRWGVVLGQGEEGWQEEDI